MRKIWADEAWKEYLYWQGQDRKTLNRINKLIKDIERNGNTGIGNPEPLKYEWSGFWSREIDAKNRLIYRLDGEMVEIAVCGGHYYDK